MAVITPPQEATKVQPADRRGGLPARKYSVELIGAFFLVFTVGTAVFSGSALAPLAIGTALMVMIYAGGHISGGHFNPAVTMAALVRGRIGVVDAFGYWIAQFVGGVLAALVVRGIVTRPAGQVPLHLSGHRLVDAIVAELIFTIALAWVMLNSATSKDNQNNSFYGLAIGFTVLAGAVAVGGISGGVFNPAVALGGAVMSMFAWSTFWIYLVVELVAGALAGIAFLAINTGDK
jgi:aquaporin Z